MIAYIKWMLTKANHGRCLAWQYFRFVAFWVMSRHPIRLCIYALVVLVVVVAFVICHYVLAGIKSTATSHTESIKRKQSAIVPTPPGNNPIVAPPEVSVKNSLDNNQKNIQAAVDVGQKLRNSNHDEERMRINNREHGTFVSLPYNSSNFVYPSNVDLSNIVISYRNGKPIQEPVINPHPYNYIHTADKKCDGGEDITVLLMIKSAVQNIYKRNAIRMTWGQEHQFGNFQSKRVFLLGDIATNETLRERVGRENDRYKDIIQENFIDSYRNNTLKLIMGYNWIVQFCNQVKFVLLTDDDFYVNITKLYRYIKSLLKSKAYSVYAGKLVSGARTIRSKVGKRGKWYLSPEEYPYDQFPPMIPGGAYIVSRDVAEMFAIAFPYVRPIFIDDSYLGIVAKKLNITPTHANVFETDPGPQKQYRLKNLIAFHLLNIKDMYTYWSWDKKMNNMQDSQVRILTKK